MAEKLLMLALSPTMEEGAITNWLKKEGDQINPGDALCEVETDKAVMEYQATNAGALLKIVKAPGQSARIGEPIAIIGQPGEDIANLLAETEQTPPPAQQPQTEQPLAEKPEAEQAPQTPQEQHPQQPPQPTPAPQPQQAAPQQPQQPQESPIGPPKKLPGIPSEMLAVKEPLDAHAAPAVRPTTPAPEQPSHFRSSPLARRFAEKHHIDLAAVSGSGPQGRIVEKDVENALAQHPAPPAVTPPAAPSTPTAALPLADQAIPVSAKRKLIAQRLAQSKFTAPHYYLRVTAAIDRLLDERKRHNAAADEKLSFNAYLIKLTADTLKHHPMLNASWQGETILQHARVDVALAVAQDEGLITPVVRNAHTKDIIQIDRELKQLIQKAQQGALSPEEYANSTFTITNLGSYGIEEFTAIINPPNAAILAVGRVLRQNLLDESDTPHPHSTLRLTLSCDHRLVDGVLGARFLTDLKNTLENPLQTLY